jgi:hypothetical protein
MMVTSCFVSREGAKTRRRAFFLPFAFFASYLNHIFSHAKTRRREEELFSFFLSRSLRLRVSLPISIASEHLSQRRKDWRIFFSFFPSRLRAFA